MLYFRFFVHTHENNTIIFVHFLRNQPINANVASAFTNTSLVLNRSTGLYVNFYVRCFGFDIILNENQHFRDFVEKANKKKQTKLEFECEELIDRKVDSVNISGNRQMLAYFVISTY